LAPDRRAAEDSTAPGDRPGATAHAPRTGPWPAATTRVVGIIGDPVRHSLSPALHNAAFAALDLDWVYLAFPVAAGEVATALDGMRALGLEGLSVTMPHKQAAAAKMDRLSPTARRLGAVNTVVRRGRELVGETTDGDGLILALANDEGWDAAGRRCAVLGTGGGARAVVLALAEAGAAEVAVIGRRPEAVEAAVSLAGAAGVAGTIEQVAAADLVVNATPVGMAGLVGLDGRLPSDLPFELTGDRLAAGQVVVDLIYTPRSTPLLNEARARGALAVNGLGMLIHQAALQFRLWTGEEPPLEAMSAAAVAALAHQDHDPRV
jgi:shikimate dehydrogenase